MRFDFESLVDEVERSVVLLEAVGQDARMVTLLHSFTAFVSKLNLVVTWEFLGPFGPRLPVGAHPVRPELVEACPEGTRRGLHERTATYPLRTAPSTSGCQSS